MSVPTGRPELRVHGARPVQRDASKPWSHPPGATRRAWRRVDCRPPPVRVRPGLTGATERNGRVDRPHDRCRREGRVGREPPSTTESIVFLGGMSKKRKKTSRDSGIVDAMWCHRARRRPAGTAWTPVMALQSGIGEGFCWNMAFRPKTHLDRGSCY